MTNPETKNIGLRGVTVADSQVSFVDGANGRLLYRGFAIEDLAENATFEEVVFLLLHGGLPKAAELEWVQKALREARKLPEELIAAMKTRPRTAQPMDVLQAAVAQLADDDPGLGSADRGALVGSALRLISRTGQIVAAWQRIRDGKEPVVADADLSVAGAFLHALWGKRPTDAEARLMDLLLVLHAEHTFNASTFATREIASTKAHMYAAVAGGVGALSGALHGGANARVMEMLLEIGSKEAVSEWVEKRVSAGLRVMGLGHAVYKTEDPRAGVLRKVAEETLAGRPEERWFELALEVEKEGRAALQKYKNLDLYPNVDFYSGPVLYAIGLPTDMFPAFFAVSRVSGWTAHVIEEQLAEAQPKPALYRPRAHYTGRFCGPQGCRWVPLEARGSGCPRGKGGESCSEEIATAEQ